MKLQVPKLNALKAKEEPAFVTMDGADEAAVDELFVGEVPAEEKTDRHRKALCSFFLLLLRAKMKRV